MPQMIFTFTINTETQEAAFAGNVEVQVALQVLQQLVIAEAIKQAEAARQTQENSGKIEEKEG